MSPRAVSLWLFVAAVSGCLEVTPREDEPAGRLQLDIAPLSLPDLASVTYSVRVARGDPGASAGVDSDASSSTVWTRSVNSAAYGTPDGDITYIGTCDASDQDPNTPQLESVNTLYLVIEQLATSLGPGTPTILVEGTDYINPCPASAPCIQTAPCLENQDTAIAYNLTVMRRAKQGFFDVAVNFQDIFCSGKVDCAPALLHDSTGQRARTTVAAFACTAGADLDADPTNDTHLFANDLVVYCKNGSNADTISILDMAATGGGHGADSDMSLPEAVDKFALFGGIERIDGYKKGYWNLAFTLASAQTDCRLTGAATAAAGNWPTGTSPANTIYPVILFDDIDLGAANGACHTPHPLDGPDSDVHTAYTSNLSRCFGNVGVITSSTLDRSDTPCGGADPCATNHGGCAPLAACYDAGGKAFCGPCPAGYSGTGNTDCVDINECNLGTDDCDPLVTCTNTPGSFTCGNCPPGYSGTGKTICSDINECLTNNGGCDPLTTCTNTPGSRTCGACPQGYSGSGETGCNLIVPVSAVFSADNVDVNIQRSVTLTLNAISNGSPYQFPSPSRNVSISSSDPTCVAAPSTVTVYSGTSYRSFGVTGGSTPCSADITMSDPVLGTDSITVTVHPLPDLGQLSLTSTQEYKVGASLKSTILVSLPAGRPAHSTISITLTSSDPSVVAFEVGSQAVGETTVNLSSASNSVSVTIIGRPAKTGLSATITASHIRCDTGTTSIEVVPHIIRLHDVSLSRIASSTASIADDGFGFYVGIKNSAGGWIAQAVSTATAPLVVTLSISGDGSATVVNASGAGASRTVSLTAYNYVYNLNASTSLLAVRLGVNPTSGNYILRATSADSDNTYSESTKTISVTISTSVISLTDASNSSRVGVRLQQQYTLTLTSGHPALNVTLSSSAPDMVTFSTSGTTAGPSTGVLDIAFASTENTKTIFVQTNGNATPGSVEIRARAPGYVDKDQVITITNSVLQITGLNFTNNNTSEYYNFVDDPFQVGTGIIDPNNGNARLAQPVSAVVAPLVVTVSKTVSSMGALETLDAFGDTVVTLVAANANATPSSLAAGGVVMDLAFPAESGNFSITASAPGFTSTPSLDSVNVTSNITPATITLTGGTAGDRLGAGLATVYTMSMNMTHSGVTIRATSSNPDVLRIATSNGSATSQASFDMAFSSTATSRSFSLHGVTGTTGTSTLTLECVVGDCFFDTVSRTITVVPVRPSIVTASSYSGTTVSAQTTEALSVSISIRDGNNAAVTNQGVAGSMAPLPISIDIDGLWPDVYLYNAADGTSSHLVTSYIASASVSTPTTAAGSVYVKYGPNLPAGNHTVTINAVTPSGMGDGLTTKSIPATVTQAWLELKPGQTALGNGLVEVITVNLKAGTSYLSTHAPLNVTVNHQAGPWLSTTQTGAGDWQLDLSFPNGTSQKNIYLIGSGDNRIVATAPSATSANLTLPSRDPFIRLLNGASEITSYSLHDATAQISFGLRVKILDAAGIERVQPAAYGGYFVSLFLDSSSTGCTINPLGYAAALIPAGSTQISGGLTVTRNSLTGFCDVTVEGAYSTPWLFRLTL